jgi:hypothetical protein
MMHNTLIEVQSISIRSVFYKSEVPNREPFYSATTAQNNNNELLMTKTNYNNDINGNIDEFYTII